MEQGKVRKFGGIKTNESGVIKKILGKVNLPLPVNQIGLTICVIFLLNVNKYILLTIITLALSHFYYSGCITTQITSNILHILVVLYPWIEDIHLQVYILQ